MSTPDCTDPIPAELRKCPQWLVWDTKLRDGKRTKVPRASTTDPSRWKTYETARAIAECGRASGIGFVFTADDPYVGVDLDACIIDGVIHPAAQVIIDLLGSYTEVSPSGTGVHIIVRGALPEDAGNRTTGGWGGSLEVYDRGRFFTMTEQGRGAIVERTRELAQIASEHLPRRAPAREFDWDREPAVGEGFPGTDDELLTGLREERRFRDLWDGRTIPRGKDGDSGQDFRLCALLAEYVGDHPRRIERLWARSALAQRSKFNREDYRAWTIARAVAASRTEADRSSSSLKDPRTRRSLNGGSSFVSSSPIETTTNRRVRPKAKPRGRRMTLPRRAQS